MSEINIRDEVTWFAQLMEQALQKNDPKYGTHGWYNCTIEELLIALEDHILKLRRRQLKVNDAQQLIYDVTDIANYAMMIADLANSLQKNDTFIRKIDEGLANICAGRVIGNDQLKIPSRNFDDEHKAITEEQRQLDALKKTCEEATSTDKPYQPPDWWPPPPKPPEEQDLSYWAKKKPWHLSDEEFEKMTGAKFTVLKDEPPTQGPITEKEKEILRRGGFDLRLLEGDDPTTSYMQELCANSFATSSVALLLDIDDEKVNFCRKSRKFYAFSFEGCWFFPKFQFTGNQPLAGFDSIITAVRPDLHPLAFCRWMETPDPDLYLTDEGDKPMSPLQWLQRGGAIKPLREIAKHL